MLVSVIINVLNGESYLKEAITSALSQSYTEIEIIVFDNASIDNTKMICQSFGKDIRYIRNDQTDSLYAARNRALEYCSGEYISFLDCDDIWHPDKILKQMALMKGRSDAIVYTGYSIVQGPSDNFKLVKNVYPYRSHKITNHLFLRNKVSIGSVLIPMEIMKRFSFNSNYNLLGDFDLWVQLSIWYPFYSVRETLEYCRHHDNNLSDKKSSDWLGERRRFLKSIFKELKFTSWPFFLYYVVKTELKGSIGS